MELKHDDRLTAEQMNDAELDQVQGATLNQIKNMLTVWRRMGMDIPEKYTLTKWSGDAEGAKKLCGKILTKYGIHAELSLLMENEYFKKNDFGSLSQIKGSEVMKIVKEKWEEETCV